MGLFSLFKRKEKEKNKNPEITDKGIQRKRILEQLSDKVDNDQKEVIEEQIKRITAGNAGKGIIAEELKASDSAMTVLENVMLGSCVSDSFIDFLLITVNGIIIIETKSLSGSIEITKNGDFMKNYVDSTGIVYKKEKMYNPQAEIRKHISTVKKILKENNLFSDFEFYPLLVISNPETVIDVSHAPKEIQDVIVRYDELNSRIEAYLSKSASHPLIQREMADIVKLINENDAPDEAEYVEKLGLKINGEPSALSVKIINDPENKEDSMDDTLYETLRAYRMAKSRELSVKPYIIFTNENLNELCLKKPSSKEELLKISGFGERKAEAYGADIISIIKNSISEENGNETEKKPAMEDELYKKLKSYRFKKSKELDVPIYYIFSNQDLENLLEAMPKNKEEFLEVKGFGKWKYEKFGEEILAILNE